MISSQAHDLAISLAKSLGLDDQSDGETCRTNGCDDEPDDKAFGHLKVRVHLHDDKEVNFSPGVTAAEPPIDAYFHQAVHEVDRFSDDKRALGRRLVRTVAFGIITGVFVSTAFAWQFYRDNQRKHMVGAEELRRPVNTKSSSSGIVPVEMAAKTSDRVPAQEAALLQAAPAIPSSQVPVAPGSSSEQQHQLETLVSDVAVVRQIVERIAAVQEQMALDIATLQKPGQNVSQKASLPTHPPAVPVPPRKYPPRIARSDDVVHSSPVPVPAPTQSPHAPH